MAENCIFQISPPKRNGPTGGPGNRGGARESELARPQYLILGTFTSTPRLHFERLQLPNTRTRVLVVRNPSDIDTWFRIKKMPRATAKFELICDDEAEHKMIPAQGQLTITVKWAPTEAGHCCETITCESGLSAVTLTVQLLGEAEPGPVKSKSTTAHRFTAVRIKPPPKSVLGSSFMNVPKSIQMPGFVSKKLLASSPSRRETYLVPPTPNKVRMMGVTSALSGLSFSFSESEEDVTKENCPPGSTGIPAPQGQDDLSSDSVFGQDSTEGKDNSFGSTTTAILTTTTTVSGDETQSDESPGPIRASEYFMNSSIFSKEADLEGELIDKAFEQLEETIEFIKNWKLN